MITLNILIYFKNILMITLILNLFQKDNGSCRKIDAKVIYFIFFYLILNRILMFNSIKY